MYLYLKAVHIICVITWFAGLFYLVRLFVYHAEAKGKSIEESKILIPQFKLMEKRLWYGITWPSAVIATTLGFGMIHNFMPISDHPWIAAKLIFVALLLAYHLYCGHLYKKMSQDIYPLSETGLRIFNEAATVLLVAIVFLVVLKSTADMGKGMIGLVIFSVILLIGIRIYRQFGNTKK